MPLRLLCAPLAALFVVAATAATAADLASGPCSTANPCVTVDFARYGVPGGPSCNPTGTIRSGCSGRRLCEFRADNGLCGDPAPGRTKQLSVTWLCGEVQHFDGVAENGVLQLGCGEADPAR